MTNELDLDSYISVRRGQISKYEERIAALEEENARLLRKHCMDNDVIGGLVIERDAARRAAEAWKRVAKWWFRAPTTEVKKIRSNRIVLRRFDRGGRRDKKLWHRLERTGGRIKP